jgi:hypothetical protein
MRAVGVESEMELAFAGLRQLCVPMLGRLDGLPDPQRDALQTAFGLSPAGRAGSVPGGIGGAEPVVGRGGGAAAPPLLLRAAKRLEPLDVGLARATYLEALAAAQFAGRFAVDGNVVEVAHAALAAPPAAQRPRLTRSRASRRPRGPAVPIGRWG